MKRVVQKTGSALVALAFASGCGVQSVIMNSGEVGNGVVGNPTTAVSASPSPAAKQATSTPSSPVVLATIAVGIAVPLQAPEGKEVLWSSLDTSIATVSSKGVVTGKSPGATTIVSISKSNPNDRAQGIIKVVERAKAA